MNLNQEEVRQRLCRYISERGIKQTYISNVLNLHASNLSRFKQEKLNLSMKDLIKLNQFLSAKGY